MKKRLCFILILLFAFSAVCGCEQTIMPLDGTPLPQTTPVPTMSSLVEYSYSDEEIAIAQEKYEISTPTFEQITRVAEEPLRDIQASRYTISDDGVYRSNSVINNGTATFMFTGDLMCQGRQQLAANVNGTYDFDSSFDYVKSIFSTADFVTGNLETMLSESAPYMSEVAKVDDVPHCNAPVTYLDALRYAGFDALVTANNHACDTGVRGILETRAHLDTYGFMHTGTFVSEDDPRYILADVEGIRIAILSYTTKYNGKDKLYTDLGKEVLLNRYSVERLKTDLAEVRALGAEFVFAYNHWGVEHTNDENEFQRECAQEMANAGVDYIIGSHPHSLQRYDILTTDDGREVPVVYSMGNFVSHMKKVVNKDTIILKVELSRDEAGQVEISSEGYIPCRVFLTFLGGDYVVVPVTDSYNQGRTSKYFAGTLERVQTVIGDKINCLM